MPDTKKPEDKIPEERFVLADEKFQEYVRSHHKFTIDHLKGESETPHLLVVTRNIDTLEDELAICCLAVDFNEAEEKQKLMFAMGAKFYDEKMIVLAVILSSECWTSKRPAAEAFNGIMPRDDPKRQEGILVAGAGMNPKQRMVIITPIRRDEKNNIVVDGKPDEMISEKAEFFLINYFWKGYMSKVKVP